MKTLSDLRSGQRAQTRGRAAADTAAGLAGLVVLIAAAGHGLGLRPLVGLRPELPSMSPVTALALALLVGGVLASVRSRLRLAAGAAGLAAVLAAGVLFSRAVADTDAISAFVESTVFGAPAGSFGRTAVATACAILLVAGALALRRTRANLSNVCAGAAMVISGTAVLGYTYGQQQIDALGFFNGIALPSAAALLLLSVATILIDSRSGWAAIIASPGPGGGATRRQLLFTLLPPIAGWVLLQLTDRHAIGIDAAMTLLVMVTIVPLALLVLRDGRVLIALEDERRARGELLEAHTTEMEAQLATQARQLERESQERRKAEAAMYAAQRLESVGQLTGGIAHDFNNLLMGISGNLQLMRRKLADDHPAMRNAVNASAAVERGSRLTAQLLTFSRSQKLHIRAVQIQPLLAQARELIGHALGPHIDIEIRDHSAGAWARTDGDQLELAILNLVVNARDAMPDGGKVVVEAQTLAHAFADGDAAREAIAIRVIDHGTGMAPEVAERAMEPFYTTKERGKGTGLGLAQVHGFTLQCGGDLRLTTAPGAGTTVEMVLRQTEAGTAEATPPAVAVAASRRSSARRRLLVIDDDDEVRRVIVELLGGAGFEVTERSDGPGGLAELARWRPDAAVIDFIMPGMNGAEVARRAQVLHPGLPILFVSGYSDTLALDGIAEAAVLRKPFDDESLQRAVAQILH